MADDEIEDLTSLVTGDIPCGICGKKHIFFADYKEAFLLNKRVYVRCSVSQGRGGCNFWFDKVMSPEEYRENARKIGVSPALIEKVLEGPPF